MNLFKKFFVCTPYTLMNKLLPISTFIPRPRGFPPPFGVVSLQGLFGFPSEITCSDLERRSHPRRSLGDMLVTRPVPSIPACPRSGGTVLGPAVMSRTPRTSRTSMPMPPDVPELTPNSAATDLAFQPFVIAPLEALSIWT